MLTSISRLGERARGHDRTWTVAIYSVASVVGGLSSGLLLGAIGRLLPLGHRPLWAAAACAAAVLLDVARRVPTIHRQVDEDWLSRYRRWVYATGFGWQLGTGVTTVITSGATYAWLGLVVLQGSLSAALLVGAVFGLVRALPLVLLHADTPAALRATAASIADRSRPAAAATVVVLACGSAVLVLT